MLLDELNEPQAAAVAHTQGPLIVFAGAGSGKTRVITYRVANLVACAQVPPWRILAVTFTNKAAGEMRTRVESLCGAEVARSLWVGTFHATCARLLRVHGGALGVQPNFLIYDANDQKAVVTRALKDLDLDDRRFPPRAILTHIHKHKQEGRGPDEAAATSYVDDVALRIFREYEAQLRAANAVDFEDLILLVTRLLERTEEGDRIRRRFDYVLVDEFQDTNATQYRLLRELARDHGNLCVVGDDDQSIYRWRGADVRNIRGFRRDYPGALVVKLEQNYRSTKRIVASALAVIGRSTEREPKELWTANSDGEAIRVVLARDERDEAAFVADAIKRARERGTEARDVAVFYRVHAQSRVLEEALRAANIPYQIFGGARFYERAEIKDALAYLRIVVNPRSEVDLLRVVNVPARGIGTTTMDRVVAWAKANDVSTFDALARLEEIGDLGTAAKKKLAAFRELLSRVRAASEQLLPSELLALILADTGYVAALEKEDTAEADARAENLQELVGSMRDYEAEAEAAGEKPSLLGFLERVTLSSDVDGMEEGGRVALMTVHSAKGLEFERVLLTGMEEEMFPYKGIDPAQREELEEERRLAYVAITRARRQLTMIHAQTRQIFGTTRWNRPSRFLAELPSAAAEHVATKAATSEATAGRYIDREAWGGRPGDRETWGGRSADRETWGSRSGSREKQADARSHQWRHPQATVQTSSLKPGDRYVDNADCVDAVSAETSTLRLRRGARVKHDRFGEGRVLSVVSVGEPAVVAFFPGWGERKILARFLKPA
jgi:DNA helicase-2/ATP-dependent DNA helicase PcrA